MEFHEARVTSGAGLLAYRELDGALELTEVAPTYLREIRLQLFILAYNLGNFLRRLGLPRAVKGWSLRSLQVKLIKIGGRIVRHARRIVFQLAEVAMSRELFAAILEQVTRLRLAPG